MNPEDAVLDANAEFYRAFADKDLPAMKRLWSRSQLVACIHPGWHALFGRHDVMASWEAILTSEQTPRVECPDATAIVLGDSALVVCTESLGGGELVATNLFVREGDAWKMVHHQAAPFSRDASDAGDREPDRSLN
ncbi:MAG TPA: nuclear transport factor 2 family protein [Polyangiaceae bacterium]|nr:nuclear transport factor 2 family protein [Polyangiaceae bacterium]